MDGGLELRHSLGLARELYRRCLINREGPRAVARSLGLDTEQCVGVVRLMKSVGYRPSDERLAVVLMRDPGMDDEAVAEIFGRSLAWATAVRKDSAQLRELERIADSLEYYDDGLQPDDPLPHEILARAEAERGKRVQPDRLTPVTVHCYQWTGQGFAPFSAGTPGGAVSRTPVGGGASRGWQELGAWPESHRRRA